MEQFGFRSHHSTSDALVLTVEQIKQAQVARLYIGVAFVDMSKAFDKVQHQTLVSDLYALGIGGVALQWMAHYLTDRQQYVQIGQSKSAAYASSCGVPQGSVLGPLLFVVYVRDIPHVVRPYGVITPTQFADDISLRASAETPAIVAQRLSSGVQHLSDWLRQRGLILILNETKTQIPPIPPHRAPPFALRVTCNSQDLPVIPSAKYLGLHFDTSMCWQTMVQRVAIRCLSPPCCIFTPLMSYLLLQMLCAA